jgi:uncharacterized sulfatase
MKLKSSSQEIKGRIKRRNPVIKNKTSSLVRGVCALGFTAGLATVKADANDRPNILWLSVEDISPHLGCYGDPCAITPNLDTLAKQGTRFTRVFTTQGVCHPARSGIITGMYPNTIGTHHMIGEWATLPEWVRPFPQYLREAGYYCTNNGKESYQFTKPSSGDIWDESSHQAHWRNRKDGQPFFAVFNFMGTHETGMRNDPWYRRVTSVLSKEQRRDPKAFANIPPYYPDTPVVRDRWKRNYELITAMDAWVGEKVAELKAAGEWDNTIVVFWSDHGIGLPRAKRFIYDSGTHVPLIMHIPEAFREHVPLEPGAADGRLISSVDFGPTMLHLAGIDRPEWMQGVSFLDPATPRRYAFSARDRMGQGYDVIRSVRDSRFRYIRNVHPLKPYFHSGPVAEACPVLKEIRRAGTEGTLPAAAALFAADHKPVEELYDLESDPHEINNLATDPAHSEKLAELRRVLSEWQLRIGDLGLIPESEMARLRNEAGSDYAVLRMEEDPEATIKRLLAAAEAASTGPDFDRLRKFVADPHPSVRYWGATGVGNFAKEAADVPEVLETMKKALLDPAPAVRIAVARALCRMGHAGEGLPVLTQELAGDNLWARLEAANVLHELGEVARPALEALRAALVGKPDRDPPPASPKACVIQLVNMTVNKLLGTENRVP